jgi:hypothetical protein
MRSSIGRSVGHAAKSKLVLTCRSLGSNLGQGGFLCSFLRIWETIFVAFLSLLGDLLDPMLKSKLDINRLNSHSNKYLIHENWAAHYQHLPLTVSLKLDLAVQQLMVALLDLDIESRIYIIK